MKSICMYTPSSDGGHARYTHELLTALSQQPRGFRYELVTSEDFNPEYRSDLYSIHTILPELQHRNSYRNKLSWAASRVLHYAKREQLFLKWLKLRPDIVGVHFQEWTPWLAAPLFRRVRKIGKRVFYTVHNIVPHKYPRFLPKSVMHRWVRAGCRECDCLFVHTKLLAQDLSQFLNGEHPPIKVVPHGVWTTNTAPKSQPLEHRLAQKRLLFFGTIRRNKGLHILLDAAESMLDVRITVAGEVLDRAYYSSQIVPRIDALRRKGAQIDLIDHFVPESKVAELLAAHSALVLPYTDEFKAQSGVVFLALAHQIPVITTEVGGLRDLLSHYKIGPTFDHHDPAALAGAVRSLLSGTDCAALTEQLCAARDAFSWQETARRTIDGYLHSQQSEIEIDERAIETTTAH
jgi:glycosyltransferase involved in cell wall biosynthesis